MQVGHQDCQQASPAEQQHQRVRETHKNFTNHRENPPFLKKGKYTGIFWADPGAWWFSTSEEDYELELRF